MSDAMMAQGGMMMKKLDPNDYTPGTLAYQLACIAIGRFDLVMVGMPESAPAESTSQPDTEDEDLPF